MHITSQYNDSLGVCLLAISTLIAEVLLILFSFVMLTMDGTS